MRNILILAFAIFTFGALHGQVDFNIESLANVDIGEAGNDVWGFVDSNGIEYAIMGSQTKTTIFSLEDPTNPIERIAISGASSVWRDIKHFDNYLYVVADEGTDGLLIIDMTNAPEDITFKFWTEDPNNTGYGTLRACHNLYVNDDGYCYLTGCGIGNGGILILDIKTDPLNPTYVGDMTDDYCHDVYVQDDLMYTSEIYRGEFGVYDVSDKTNPIRLARQATTMLFTHNAWASHDGKYLFTTDERGNSYVDSYDISDLNNIQRLDQFQPATTAGQGVVPHNTHYLNGYLYTSWYTDGMVIMDANRPDNLVQVGAYDTYFGPNGGTSGCWGAYPFLPSGLLLASDRSTGLHILQPQIERASYLEGTVVDKATGLPINGATVQVLGESQDMSDTDGAGFFKAGVAKAGMYEVTGTHPDYMASSTNIELTSGEVTEVIIELEKLVTISIAGSVLTDEDGSPIEGASVVAISDSRVIDFTTDGNGLFTLEVFNEEYAIYAGAWGYQEQELLGFNPSNSGPLEFRLVQGYKDDFVLDQGWTVNSTAATGIWVRDTPIATFSNQGLSNQGSDIATDLGTQAYITGNGGGGAGEDDVDDGNTILTSKPMDLSNLLNPGVSFEYYFYNAGGETTPDDELTITLSTPTDSYSESYSNNTNGWIPKQIAIPSNWTDLSAVTISYATEDLATSGHLVEAGVDVFLAIEGVSSTKELLKKEYTVYPNAFSNFFSIQVEEEGLNQYKIYNIKGQLVLTGQLQGSQTTVNTPNLDAGTYFIQLFGEDGRTAGTQIVKQ